MKTATLCRWVTGPDVSEALSAFISRVRQFVQTGNVALVLNCLTCGDEEPTVYRNVGNRSPNNRTTIEHVSNTAVITTNVTVIYLFNLTVVRFVDVCCGT